MSYQIYIAHRITEKNDGKKPILVLNFLTTFGRCEEMHQDGGTWLKLLTIGPLRKS